LSFPKQKQKLRVSITSPSFDPSVNVSGVSKIVHEICGALGDRITFVHLQIGSMTGKNIQFRTLRSIIQTVRSARSILFDRSEIFHSNTALNPKSILRDLVLCAIAAASRKKILLHVHGGLYLDKPAGAGSKLLIELLFMISSKIVVLSLTEKRNISIRFPRYSEKIEYLYNGISCRPDRTKRSYERAALVVGFVGRFVVEKGFDLFIEISRCSFPFPVEFVAYGDGPLRALLLEQSVRDKVHYGGTFNFRQTREVFEKLDLLALPSRAGEGMPMVIIEAMAMGCVPIATELGSIREMMQNETSGILIQHQDDEQMIRGFVKAISSLGTSISIRASLSRAAIDNFEKNFNIDGNAERLNQIYMSLVS